MQYYDIMTKPREIVIEYERIQLIRKRAVAKSAHCRECSRNTDFASVRDVAELFELSQEDLIHFIQINNCHYRVAANAKIQLCVASLLACMKTQTLNQQIKMIGA